MLHPIDDRRTWTDALEDRNAAILVRLRKIIRRLHAVESHVTETWTTCPHPICLSVWETIERRPAPHRMIPTPPVLVKAG